MVIVTVFRSLSPAVLCCAAAAAAVVSCRVGKTDKSTDVFSSCDSLLAKQNWQKIMLKKIPEKIELVVHNNFPGLFLKKKQHVCCAVELSHNKE